MKNALLEIGVESLPARFVPPALRQMERLALELLKAERLPHGAIRVFGTPMRLALVIEDVQDRSEAAVREASGPPARLLKDAQGAFTPQALGFAKAQGVKPEELETKTTPKGEVLCARKTLPGEGAPKVLERVFPALVAGIEFPKTLEWEESRFRFGRPIRTLVALLGGKVVPFQLAGVQSGAKTRGLAALGYPSVPLTPEGYLQTLRDACVLADPAERRAAMLEGLRKAAGASSGRLDEDEALVEQVVNLCEHPVPVLGHFDKAFLELPQSLLTTVLKTQLRFFPLLGRDGRLAAEFIGVRDGVSEGQKDVQDGYQRVLSARFSDARFFFRRDRESTLEQKRAVTKALLASGASIGEINCVRKHLSAIKGGRLALAAGPARVLTLAISDVPGDELSTIASGPTVPDPTTCAEALEIVARHGIALPAAAREALLSGAGETPKPGDAGFARCASHIIATARGSLAAAADAARAQGIAPLVLGDAIEGEAREAARVLGGIALSCAMHGLPLAAPCVLLSGGETTVTVRGGGRGGRNAEFLLGLALALNGHAGIHAIACDTDGIDGSEDNAGALLLPDSVARAAAAGIDLRVRLAENDAYGVFAALNDLVVTGPTRTNVNDFRAILIEPMNDPAKVV